MSRLPHVLRRRARNKRRSLLSLYIPARCTVTIGGREYPLPGPGTLTIVEAGRPGSAPFRFVLEDDRKRIEREIRGRVAAVLKDHQPVPAAVHLTLERALVADPPPPTIRYEVDRSRSRLLDEHTIETTFTLRNAFLTPEQIKALGGDAEGGGK